MSDCGVPDLQMEIDRKAYNALSWRLLQFQKGEIDGKQLTISLDTLFMAVSGLVADRDFIHAFDQIYLLGKGSA